MYFRFYEKTFGAEERGAARENVAVAQQPARVGGPDCAAQLVAFAGNDPALYSVSFGGLTGRPRRCAARRGASRRGPRSGHRRPGEQEAFGFT